MYLYISPMCLLLTLLEFGATIRVCGLTMILSGNPRWLGELIGGHPPCSNGRNQFAEPWTAFTIAFSYPETIKKSKVQIIESAQTRFQWHPNPQWSPVCCWGSKMPNCWSPQPLGDGTLENQPCWYLQGYHPVNRDPSWWMMVRKTRDACFTLAATKTHRQDVEIYPRHGPPQNRQKYNVLQGNPPGNSPKTRTFNRKHTALLRKHPNAMPIFPQAAERPRPQRHFPRHPRLRRAFPRPKVPWRWPWEHMARW